MITLLFGAGASFGSQNSNCPPLGAGLFDALCEREGEFRKIPEDIKEVFRQDFEEGMARLDNDSTVYTPLQRELAMYLSEFTPSPGNIYIKLLKLIKPLLKKKIHLATLNYDLLIENSLLSLGHKVKYQSEGPGVRLIKPHGSCNFLTRMPGNVVIGNLIAKRCTGSSIDGAEIFIAQGSDEIHQWCNDPNVPDYLSPMMAMYNKGKRVLVNGKQIESLQQEYSDAISNSELVILVGVKHVEHDDHIWEPIKGKRPDVIVVDPFSPDDEYWSEQIGISPLIIKKGFSESVEDIHNGIRRQIANSRAKQTKKQRK